MSGAPGYSQSMFTPSRPYAYTQKTMLLISVLRFAAVTPVRKMLYVLGDVEKSQPPIDRIFLGPWILRNFWNWFDVTVSGNCSV